MAPVLIQFPVVFSWSIYNPKKVDGCKMYLCKSCVIQFRNIYTSEKSMFAKRLFKYFFKVAKRTHTVLFHISKILISFR